MTAISHRHYTTGLPCSCSFTAHLDRQAKTAGKLHDFLMNPKSRPDLQTPEGQNWLRLLAHWHEHHGERFDALTPWLTREWKKGRMIHNIDPESAARNPDHHGHMYWRLPVTHGLTGESGYERQPMNGDLLGHWTDFYHSNHPLRRELGDIMQHDVQGYAERVKAWDEAMKAEASDKALQGGQVVHTTPDNWTVRQLTTPQELKAEGDAMGHCVGGYSGMVARGDSLIYSLRDPQGRPHATTEIHPKYIDWRGKRIDRDNLDLSQPLEPGEEAGVPIPHKGLVQQIQGKANQEPHDEYKARLADWFRSFHPEDRPQWDPTSEDGDYLHDDDGYVHNHLDDPALIPVYERQNNGLAIRTEPGEDAYGLPHPAMIDDYQSLGYQSPHQIHPEQQQLWDPATGRSAEGLWDSQYGDKYPMSEVPSVFSKLAALYQRWVFSPASGQVELADNDGDPLDVRYHGDLARELSEPNLLHGYAYPIGGGWRLTDWESKPVSDPYVVAQVMRALKASEARPEPRGDLWEPDWGEDWDRIHMGLPS